MIRIGEFSKLAKSTIKTLRFYDEINLFKPYVVDDNGYRYYSIEQLNELQLILKLRSVDMPIDEIRQVISGKDIISTLQNRQKELTNELQKNQENLSLIKKFIEKAKKGEIMEKYQAKTVTLPKCVVFFRHDVIKNMGGLVPFILEAGEEVTKVNPTLKCLKPDYCYVVYGAKEYKEENVEVEYAQAVEGFGKESENIKFKEINATKAISVMHKGSYSKLGEAYAFALNYVKEKGYEVSESIRESYIDGCWNKEDESEYLTEIQIPIK